MRRGTLRRLASKNPNGLTWNQAAGAYDPRSGVVGYRTIEGREYKVPANPAEEKAAVDRIIAAANKRRRKAGLEPLNPEEFYGKAAEGTEPVVEQGTPADEGQEGRTQDAEAGTDAAPELDFGSFLSGK